MDSDHAADTLAELTYRFFHHLDEFRYADLLAMMRPDAVWRRQGRLVSGHKAILAELDGRSRTQRIRHVISNSFIDSRDEKSATVKAYMVAYRYDDGTVRQPPLAIDGPFRMLLLTTRFVRESKGNWLIAELSAVPEFEFPTAPIAS